MKHILATNMFGIHSNTLRSKVTAVVPPIISVVSGELFRISQALMELMGGITMAIIPIDGHIICPPTGFTLNICAGISLVGHHFGITVSLKPLSMQGTRLGEAESRMVHQLEKPDERPV